MGNCLSKPAEETQNVGNGPISSGGRAAHSAVKQSNEAAALTEGHDGSRVPMDKAPSEGELVTKRPSSMASRGIVPGGKETPTTLPTPNASMGVGMGAMKEKEKEKRNTENKLVMLELAIQATEMVQGFVVIADLASGTTNPISGLLKKVTGVLVVLKKMVENRLAWAELLATLEEHHSVFNEQIGRMEMENLVPDPDSPLLSPINRYASALKDLTEAIIRESGFEREHAPNAVAWEKIQRIAGGFMLADLEKEQIQAYTQQLADAMKHFQLSLGIFTSFTLHNVKQGVDKMASELLVVSDDVKEMRESVIRSMGPKDTILNRRITPFGGQHSQCLKGTRVDILDDIRTWAWSLEADSPHIYCIGDVAGTGKSTIAKTLAKEWHEDAQLVAMFFFSQEVSTLGTASDFCLSVADQIEEFDNNPDLIAYWESISRSRKNLPSRDIEEQWSKLVLQPLKKLKKINKNYILVIDALDECTVVTRGPLLECLLTACSSRTLPHVRILLTTRMEMDLREHLQCKADAGIIRLRGLLSSAGTTADIALYVNNRLDGKDILLSSLDERHRLIARCGGLFIFAHLACKLLEDAHDEQEPLIDILHRFTSLDALYHQALTRADKEPRYTRKALKDTLGIILVAQSPLPLVTIATLSSISLKSASAIIKGLGSVLASSGTESPVYFLHSTFPEFLLRQTWVTAGREALPNEYAINRAQSNRMMAQSCLSVLSQELKPNMGNLSAKPDSAALQKAFRKTPVSVRYAAFTWVFHAMQELHILAIRDAARKFFREKLLNWVEFGGISGHLSYYTMSIQRLHSAMENILNMSIQKIDEEDLLWCSDAIEFLRLNQKLVHKFPLQVYSSALAFTARESRIYAHYEPCFRDSLPKIPLGRPTSNINTLMFAKHSWHISRVAYSSNGQLIVSAVAGGRVTTSGCMISVWDASTGANLLDFKLRDARAGCHGVAFLPGNEIIVSIWEDGQLYHLDWRTGILIQPPRQIEVVGRITCISWTPDWTRFVCGTSDGFIQPFSLRTGLRKGQAKASHDKEITSIAFSHDGKSAASTSRDMTFKIWNVTSEGLIGPVVLWHHTQPITYGAFYPTNPSLFAFVDGNSLFVYNAISNAIERNYDGLEAESLTISQDGVQIALQEPYDSRSIVLLKPIDGITNEGLTATKIKTSHTDWIQCMSISPSGENLVTGSWDFTIQVHSLNAKVTSSTTSAHQSMVHLLAFTFDRTRLASVDVDGYLCLWDVASGELVHEPLQTGTEYREAMALSSNASIVAFWRTHDEIQFWNTNSRKQVGATLLLDYQSPGRYHIGAMSFSPDDLTLAFTAEDTVSEVSGGNLTILNIGSIHQSAVERMIVTDIDFEPFRRKLAFHSSGKYICDGENAWSLALEECLPVGDRDLKTVIDETFPTLIQFDEMGSSIQSITLRTSKRITFYLPPIPHFRHHIIKDGLIALGAADGKVMILDFAHLFDPADKSLLNRLSAIRSKPALLSRPSPIEEVLAAYASPRSITIPRSEPDWDEVTTEESGTGESGTCESESDVPI